MLLTDGENPWMKTNGIKLGDLFKHNPGKVRDEPIRQGVEREMGGGVKETWKRKMGTRCLTITRRDVETTKQLYEMSFLKQTSML